MKHEVLSLDFWQKTTIYGDKSFPCGTIGCDALNVPTEVLDKLAVYCSLLNALLGTFNAGCGDPALLPAVRESVKQMAELLKDVKPFSYVELLFQVHCAEPRPDVAGSDWGNCRACCNCRLSSAHKETGNEKADDRRTRHWRDRENSSALRKNQYCASDDLLCPFHGLLYAPFRFGAQCLNELHGLR